MVDDDGWWMVDDGRMNGWMDGWTLTTVMLMTLMLMMLNAE